VNGRSNISILDEYWDQIKGYLSLWKDLYQWPIGSDYNTALSVRNELEKAIKDQVSKNGYLSKKLFDKIMVWGFNRSSYNTEEDIVKTTGLVFALLNKNKIVEAAIEMTSLSGIGISRATKVIALYNQNDFGIYDSRAADGLSDLIIDGKRFIPIPLGRTVRGDTNLNTYDFCIAYKRYLDVLRYFRNKAMAEPILCSSFTRVADLEMAFFSRSRNKSKNTLQPVHVTEYSKNIIDDTDKYFTLGKGKKAKQFWGFIDENGITVLIGKEGKSSFSLTQLQIEELLAHFQNRGWFPLGNCVDNIKPGGFGEYFQNVLKLGAKAASHFSAMLVYQSRLEYRYNGNAIELKVKEV